MIYLLASVLVLGMTTPPTLRATPFPISDVKLTGGPFEAAHQATSKYLLELEPDRLLAGFRANAGIPTKATIYGGWETGGLSGHSLGHYLTACSQEYARTGDKRFKDRVAVLVKGLAECQAVSKSGFIVAFRFDKGFDRPRLNAIWDEISKGELRSGGFDLNGMWSPWYVHHKLFAGLLDAQQLTGSKEALTVCKRFGDWAIDITKNLTPEQWQKMLGTEYGGMNDSLAELYVRTKDERYLELSRKFYDNRVLEPLSKGEDNLSGKHSNTQIPKLIGLGRLYEITGDEKDRKTAEFFWERVVNHHSYSIGGNSNGEYLGLPDKLSDRLSTNTAETCNTYNMLKLTRHLFSWSPSASYMDYYERAYLNHILASQDPSSGMVTYFMTLQTNSARTYSNKFDDFTCCHGSGMENHTKHGDSIYFHDRGRTLWVNLFMPSVLKWRDAGLTITQETKFPIENKVSLTFAGKAKKASQIMLRHPAWAKASIEFKLNGKVLATSTKPGSYTALTHKWKEGDSLTFELPMALHTEAMPDNPKRVSLLYGPVVLGASLEQNGASLEGPVARTPVLVTGDRKLTDWLVPVPGRPLTFATKDAAKPTELVFSPFYQLYHGKYGVYFDVFSEQEWTDKEAHYRAEEERIRDLEARTVDSMVIGEMQPERDHALTSERNDVREANGRAFRTTLNDGWFEFDMKVDPAAKQELVMTFWGNDLIKPDFEIKVDGQLIATDDHAGKPKNQLFDVVYDIPANLTTGKSKIRIRISSRPTHRGPSVSGARLVRKK